MWLQLYDRAQVDWSRDFVFSINSLVFKGLQTNEMFYFDLHTTEDDTTSVSAYNRRPKLIIIVCFIEVANCVLRVCKASIVPNNSVFFKSSVPMIILMALEIFERPLIRKEAEILQSNFFPHC